jgi:hypothetical protein
MLWWLRPRSMNQRQSSVLNETVLRDVLGHASRMTRADITQKQLVSVPCPTCGVSAGARCLLHSGAKRAEPHVDRKLLATEAIEQKKARP